MATRRSTRAAAVQANQQISAHLEKVKKRRAVIPPIAAEDELPPAKKTATDTRACQNGEVKGEDPLKSKHRVIIGDGKLEAYLDTLLPGVPAVVSIIARYELAYEKQREWFSNFNSTVDVIRTWPIPVSGSCEVLANLAIRALYMSGMPEVRNPNEGILLRGHAYADIVLTGGDRPGTLATLRYPLSTASIRRLSYERVGEFRFNRLFFRFQDNRTKVGTPAFQSGIRSVSGFSGFPLRFESTEKIRLDREHHGNKPCLCDSCRKRAVEKIADSVASDTDI